MKIELKNLLKSSIPFDFPLDFLQIANPCAGAFCSFLYCFVLACQGSPLGPGEATRPLLPVAASSGLCRSFSSFLCDFFLHLSTLQPQPPASPFVRQESLSP